MSRANVETPLRIGLIGCGRAAERIHLPALSHVKEVTLVAAADPIPERRDHISSTVQGCLAFSSAERLFQKAKLAAVIITTPSATHVDVATMALNAGVAVLCEKPLAPSMLGVAELEELIDSSKGLLMMGFNRRHWKAVIQLRRKISKLKDHDNVSTELIMITDKQAWSSISEVNDLLDDLGSHQLDLLRYIHGREISAISANRTGEQEIRMRVKLSSGGTAHCVAAYRKGLHKESATVHCGSRKYRIHAGSDRTRPASGTIRHLLDRSDKFIRNLRHQQSSFEDSYRLQLINFANYVRTDSMPHPNIGDGIAAIRAVEAARQSVNVHGMEVSVKSHTRNALVKF